MLSKIVKNSISSRLNNTTSRIFLLVVLFFNIAFSQDGVRNPVERNTVVQYLTRGKLLTFIDSKPKAKGSVYLYKDWNNRAIIKTKDGNKAYTKNINYNIDSDVFEALFKKDSIHYYNFDNIETITLNNRVYKQIEFSGDNSIFEVLFENSSVALLKKHKINIFKASSNPMVNRPKDIYTQRKSYYIKIGNSFDEVKLNKNTILKLLETQGFDKDVIKNYIKKNDLSPNNEFDVQMLLKHFLRGVNN